MTVRYGVTETAAILKNHQNMVLVGHVSPDGDALGSVMALAQGLTQLGKNVQVLFDDTVPMNLAFLPGVETIVRPTEDMHIDTELLVVLDSSSIDRIGKVAEVVHATSLVNIDHHVSNTSFADYLWLEPDATATGEMIYHLLNELGCTWTQAIATCVYVAIATDCGFFKYANTTPMAMRVAAKLLEVGVNPADISDNIELKSPATIQLLGKVLNNIQFLSEGRIGLVIIPHELYNKEVETDSFVQFPRYCEGVEVGVMMKAVEPEMVRVSLRSKQIDVSAVALAFDGGGHARAAGCTIRQPLATAKQLVLAKLEEALEKINA